MAERKVNSQIGNLTPDHYNSGIDLISLRANGVQHTIEKLLTRIATLLWTSSQSEVYAQSYGAPKLQESQLWQFQDSHLGVLGQNAIWMWASWRGTKYIITGRWRVLSSPGHGESCETKFARGSSYSKSVPTMH